MAEVVSAVRRVTDIMGEISAASNEQSQGVAQIGEAVQQMDQVTQQNAALVEEMAAAASSLRGQAHELVNTVSVFKLDPSMALSALTAPAPVQVRQLGAKTDFKNAERRTTSTVKLAKSKTKPASKPSMAASVALAPAAATVAGDWESF